MNNTNNNIFHNIIGKHFIRNPMRMLGIFSIIARFAVMCSGIFISKQFMVTLSGFTTILASIPLLFSPNRIQSDDEAKHASDKLLETLIIAQKTNNPKILNVPKSKLRIYSAVGAWNGGSYMFGMIAAHRPLDAIAGAIVLGSHILNTICPKPTAYIKDPQRISGRALQGVNILLVIAAIVAGDIASGIVGPLFIIANQGMSLANKSPEHPEIENIIQDILQGSKELDISPEINSNFINYATHYLRERGYSKELGIGTGKFTELFTS